jgi:hypothetical protein
MLYISGHDMHIVTVAVVITGIRKQHIESTHWDVHEFSTGSEDSPVVGAGHRLSDFGRCATFSCACIDNDWTLLTQAEYKL